MSRSSRTATASFGMMEDASVVSELTQETKNTMPLLSPMTPRSEDHGVRHNIKEPLAAAPLGEESDSQHLDEFEEEDSFFRLQSPVSSQVKSSLGASQVSSFGPDPYKLEGSNSTGGGSSFKQGGRSKRGVAAANSFGASPYKLEGSNSTGGGSSFKQGRRNSRGVGSQLYGMRNPSQPIIESSDESDSEEPTPSKNTRENQNEFAMDEAGYGTEDESVASARSVQRRASLQHRKMSFEDRSGSQPRRSSLPTTRTGGFLDADSIYSLSSRSRSQHTPPSPISTGSAQDNQHMRNRLRSSSSDDGNALKHVPTTIKRRHLQPEREDHQHPEDTANTLVSTTDSVELANAKGSRRRPGRRRSRNESQPHQEKHQQIYYDEKSQQCYDESPVHRQATRRRSSSNRTNDNIPQHEQLERYGQRWSSENRQPSVVRVRRRASTGFMDKDQRRSLSSSDHYYKDHDNEQNWQPNRDWRSEHQQAGVRRRGSAGNTGDQRRLMSTSDRAFHNSHNNQDHPFDSERNFRRRASTGGGGLAKPKRSKSRDQSTNFFPRSVSPHGRPNKDNYNWSPVEINQLFDSTGSGRKKNREPRRSKRNNSHSGASELFVTRRNQQSDVAPSADSFDYLPHGMMKQQRRASTGAVRHFKSILGPDLAVEDDDSVSDEDRSPLFHSPRTPGRPAVGGQGGLASKPPTRRASTGGHLGTTAIDSELGQYILKFTPPTPPLPSQKMSRRRSDGEDFETRRVDSYENGDSLKHHAPVTPDEDDKSLTEDDSLHSTENQDFSDDGIRGLKDDGIVGLRPLGFTPVTPTKPTPPTVTSTSKKIISPTRLAAARMGGGPRSKVDTPNSNMPAESDDEESTVHGYSDNEDFEDVGVNMESADESEYSMDSKKAMRRNSIQNSLHNDSLVSSLGPGAVVTHKENGGNQHLLSHRAKDSESETGSDRMEDFYASEGKSPQEAARPVLEARRQYEGGREEHGKNHEPSSPLNARQSHTQSRTTPFTTPHTPLTKDALANNARSGMPAEQYGMNKVSMHANWGDLRIQSSYDSSSESSDEEFGHNLYEDNPTLQEFDRYKQRPKRRESIDRTRINMEEELQSVKREYVPNFVPAEGCKNASDYIVRCFIARLRQGIVVLKHNRARWSKSTSRRLVLFPDGKTLSWKPTEDEEEKGKRPILDLTKCLEVRHAWTRDPDTRKQTGTSVLRKKCKDESAAKKSFSLIFAKRTLDMTAASADACKVLMEGFSALCFRLQQDKMRENPNLDMVAGDADSRVGTDDDDWASTVYGDTTASLTQSNGLSNNSAPLASSPWGL